ncbi:MAG: hypothetical protein K0S37_4339 [Microbacterium sp.]|jgi:hypothetical protein|nr:hypothetical protein [Microbacterium sp.]
MNVYDIFCRTLDDLRERIDAHPRDEYAVLRASGIVRQLLLDATPLAHSANRVPRLRPIFRVPAHDVASPIGVGGYSIRWINPDPFDAPAKDVKLDAFLKFRTIYAGGEEHSIDDVVRVCAHKLGGVHFDSSRSAGEAALAALNDSLVGDVGMLIENMAGIGKVTIRALTPLYDEARRLA